jgi:hypothetical protein
MGRRHHAWGAAASHGAPPPHMGRRQNHGSDFMPQRGIAYQPRVPTLGLHPVKKTRVLKERRILSVSRTSTPAHPMRCSFRTHLFSRMRFPERCSKLVCVAPLGQIERRRFPYRSSTSFPVQSPHPRLYTKQPPRFRPCVLALTAVPITGPVQHVSNHMPQRGIAYQPRVQTLGIHPEK